MNSNLRGSFRLCLLLVLVVMLSGCFFLQEMGFIPPDTPSSLIVSNATADSLFVTWQNATGAESYQVYRSTVESGPWTTTAYDGSATSFTDPGLAAGTYYYVVRATNAAGSSGNTAAVSGDTATVATPVISPVSGSGFSSSTTYAVTITCATSEASIYYTTDGGTPTTSSNLYSGSFTFYSNFYPPQIIKAIAVKSGLTDSGVATAEYYWGW